MSCKVKLNTIEYLQEQGAVGDVRRIVDLDKFNELNDTLTNLAQEKYAVDTNGKKLFSYTSNHKKNLDGSTNIVLRAEYNEGLFKILQIAIDSYTETETKKYDFNNIIDQYDEKAPEKLVVTDIREPITEEEIGANNEFILFDGKTKERFTASEVLENILQNFEGLNEVSTTLMEHINLVLKSTKATIKLVDREELEKEGAFMSFNRETNQIYLSKDKVQEKSPVYVVRSFLHEVVHSVTSNAYNNPITIEQEMFKSFIDEAFKLYSEKEYEEFQKTGVDSKHIGFLSGTEFLSEIFASDVFIGRIKELDNIIAEDKGSKKKSFISQFISWFRTLLKIRNNKEIKAIETKDINFNSIIKSIVNIAPTKQEYLDGNKLDFKLEKVNDDNPYRKLKTIEDKLAFSVEKIQESLEGNIRTFTTISKRTRHKDEAAADNIDKYVTDLKELLKQVTEYQANNKMASVYVFTEMMKVNMEKVKRRLDKEDYKDMETAKETLRIYKNYLNTYSVIDVLTELMSEIRESSTQTILSNDNLDKIEKLITDVSGKFSFLEKRIAAMSKNVMIHELGKLKFFPEIEYNHYNRLANEHKQSGIPEEKDTWIIRQMQNRDKELIDADLQDKVKELINSTAYDIYSQDILMSSSINVSSPLIQIMNQMLFEMDNERIRTERAKDKQFKELYEALKLEKGTTNIEELYKNILDTDKNGKKYHKSEINIDFYTDVHQAINKLLSDIRKNEEKFGLELVEIDNEFGFNSEEYRNKRSELTILKNKIKQKIENIKKENLNMDAKGKVISIKDKWKNDLSTLTKAEKDVLDFFVDITEEVHKNTFAQGKNSLIIYSFGTKFYELPKVRKSYTERIFQGDILGAVKEKFGSDLTRQADDIGYVEKQTDFRGQNINRLRVHYRDYGGTFKNDNQSLDLMTIMRLDFKNGNMFKIRRDSEFELNLLVDIAKHREYYQLEGTNMVKRYLKNQYNVISGEHSKTHQMMKNMLESKMYDILNKTHSKVGKTDINKVVGFINGTSAFLTLSLNYASGTANVLNANAQLFLESFITSRFISAPSIAKANKIYGANMAENIKDLTAPINRSFVNQVNEIFNVRGLFNLSNASFIKDDLLKNGLTMESLQVFQNSGEHWIQSITSMSTLDGVKVMNEKSQFINKNGKVVKTRKGAASVLDMMKMDTETGRVHIDPAVVYTTHSKLTKWEEGGKEKIDMLVRKKIQDTIGNYTETDQPEIMRHWWGKLLMLYRKYFIPMGQARLRGVEYAFTRKEDLQDHQKRFSYALQENEEGTYTTLLRFITTGLKDRQFQLLSTNWDNLTEYEKHNIKRAVIEIIITTVMLPLVAQFVNGLANDDDEEYLYFIAYQLRRLETELSAYRDPQEMFKMMRSPIPSARLVETGLHIVRAVFNPYGTFTDEYVAGKNKGKNRFTTKLAKQVPVLKEFQRSFSDLYKYQESSVGTGL